VTAVSAVLSWFRLDVRRRWRSLVVLMLLIALAAATVMTATAGARRGASAVDRLLAETLPATVLAAPYRPGFDWDVVRALPEVEAVAGFAFSGFEVDGQPAPESFMLPPVDAEAMWTVERPVVLDGRLADPARAHEVVVTPAFVDTYGKGVGDRVAIGLYTPEQIDTVQGPDAILPNAELYLAGLYTAEQVAAAQEAGWDLNDTAPAAGPVVEATVVGVVRSLWFGDGLDAPGFVIPSAGLFAAYEPHFRGAANLAAVNALVRLRDGNAGIPAFRQQLAAVTGHSDVAVSSRVAAARTVQHATRFEATALFVFGAVAAVAAVVLIGVAVARHAGSMATDLRVLRTVGMTPAQTYAVAVAGPTLAAVGGSAVGAAVATWVSQWFPIGTAGLVEPAPGPDVDLAVLLTGLVVVPAFVGIGSLLAAVLALRSPDRAVTSRRSAVAATALTAGVPVPVTTGARFALEPGRGARSVPVRPALIGAVAGVTGVLAAMTFTAAVEDAATNPSRHGLVHQVEAYVGYDNFRFTPAPPEEVFAALASVPGVTGVNDTRGQVATAPAGEQLNVHSFTPAGTPLDYVVTEGRMPVGPAEILLEQRSAAALDARVGDTVQLTGTSGTATFLVVGVGFTDPVFDVVMTTDAGYDALFDDEFSYHLGEVGLEPGVDPEALVPALVEALAVVPGAGPENVAIFPTDFEAPPVFRYLRPLPVLLAGFLVVLALGAVGHALAAAVRRRRYDVAVLRALGMTPIQAGAVLVTQAAVVALAGLLVGIPLGLALGRTMWRYVADLVIVHYVPPTEVLGLALAIPIVLLAAGLLALWPAQRAARTRLADVLRAE
jgi:ABC-type lipoprotein release transport system permease subunit